MSQPVLAPPVRGFLGENRLPPDDLMQPNTAVDGMNVDYSRGTIRKRLGMVKSHSQAYPKGGMRITNATNNRALIILDQTYLDLTGDFTIECLVRIESDPSGWSAAPLTKIITKRSGTDGWLLQYGPSAFAWQFLKADSAGGASFTSLTLFGDLTTDTHPVVGETYHLSAYRTGTTMGFRVTRMSDGDVVSTSGTCDGDTNNTRNVFVGSGEGSTPGNQTCDFTIDELRMWNDLRSTTELDDCKFRELTESEMADANLIGYWRMNDSENTNACEDLSVNNNPAYLSAGTPAFVSSIMPSPNSNNFAVQGNGIDNYLTAPYHSSYAPILNTSNRWMVEFWARLDTAIEWPNNAVLCQLGSTTTNNGHVFSIYIVWPGSGAAPLLKFSWSSTTTANNAEVTPATAFNPEPGVPFHVRLVRVSSSLEFYVNGTIISSTTVNTENGPTSSTSYGMTFLARNSAGTYSLLAPCTIDEVRLTNDDAWPVANYKNIELPTNQFTALVGYWKFNANSPLNEEKNDADAVTVPTSEDKPTATYGAAYPADPTDNIKLIGPVSVPVNTTNTNQGQALFSRSLLIATREAFFSQQDTTRTFLSDLATPGSDSLYSWTRYLGNLICCNGVGRNYAYNGNTVPASVTLPTDTDVPTATPTGAGGAWPDSLPTGTYTYRFTWYNSNLDIEGPYWGQVAASVNAATHDTVEIASVPTAAQMSTQGYPSVTHWRVYRLDSSATVYRRLATVAIGTTTYSDTGTSVTANTALHTSRVHLDPQNICEVFGNRLFFARGSTLRFSDADTMDFSSTSVIFVDRDDGEVIQGLKAFDGQLIVWKKTSIHVLDGDGATTFQLRKMKSGVGCVSPHTIAASPDGVYFLGHDGVYIYRGGAAQYISHSQQPLFSRIAHDQAHLATAVYHPELHQYIVSFDAFTELTEQQSEAAAEAIDSPDFEDVFTHYYRCKDGTDAVGTGGTISDSEVTHVSDTIRGTVAYSNISSGNDWSVAITPQTAVSSDFTFGFWRRVDDTSDWSVSGSMINLDQNLFIETYFLGSVTLSGAVLAFGDGVDITLYGALPGNPMTKWVHCVIRKSGSLYSLFMNGELRVVTSAADPFIVFDAMGGTVPAFHVGVPTYLDNIFWVKDVALTDQQISDLYMYETTEQVTEGVTMVFDEETKSWARHDKRFDYLSISEQSSRSAEALGGLNGFVARLNESNTDLARSDADTAQAYTRTGTLSAVTGLKITDATATFPTTGNGYAGVEAWFVPTDTTKQTQKRVILKNTATVLYLDAPLVEEFTGTYYIGPIELIWESPYFALGSEGLVRVFQYLQLWQTEAPGLSYTVQYKTNDYEDYQSLTIPTDDDFVRTEMRTRGRRIKLRVHNLSVGQVIELRSFQPQYMDAGVVV